MKGQPAMPSLIIDDDVRMFTTHVGTVNITQLLGRWPDMLDEWAQIRKAVPAAGLAEALEPTTCVLSQLMIFMDLRFLYGTEPLCADHWLLQLRSFLWSVAA